MKKKLILGFIALATAAALAGCGVEQTATEITVEAGEELQVHANDFLNVDESKAHDVTINADGVDASKVGEYELTATYKNDSYTLKVIVVDTTAPVLELASNEVTVAAIAEFIPADVLTVKDASEYTVTVVGYEDVTQKASEDDDDTDVDALPSDVSLDGLVSDAPTNEGTYRTVISVKDAYENESFVEVYVTVDAQDEEVQVEDETDSDKKDNSDKKDTSSKPSSSTSNPGNSDFDSNADSNSSASSSENKTENNSSDFTGNATEEESYSVDEEPSGLTPTQQMAKEVGFYKVFISPRGSYCVMVHDGRSEIDYVHQLIDEYLASQGLRATGGGGANMPRGEGWLYVVDAAEVAPLE